MNKLFPTLGIACGPEGFCASVWLAGYPTPMLVPDSQQTADVFTPAIIALQDGKAFVGKEAQHAARLWGLPSIELSWPTGLEETAADESLALIFKKLYHDAKAWSLCEHFKSVALALPGETNPNSAGIVLRAAKWAGLPMTIVEAETLEAVFQKNFTEYGTTQRAALAASVVAAEQNGKHMAQPFSMLRLDYDLSVAMDNTTMWPLANSGSALPMRIRKSIEAASGLGAEIRLTVFEHFGDTIRPMCTAISKVDFLINDAKVATASRMLEVTLYFSPTGEFLCTLVDADTRQWANCEVVWLSDWQRDRSRAIALNEVQIINAMKNTSGLIARV